eukprot:3323463-Rhodomonas_salina.1
MSALHVALVSADTQLWGTWGAGYVVWEAIRGEWRGTAAQVAEARARVKARGREPLDTDEMENQLEDSGAFFMRMGRLDADTGVCGGVFAAGAAARAGGGAGRAVAGRAHALSSCQSQRLSLEPRASSVER